uniref:Uncharacterized protein n=1 Tax=Anopheles albimanus TaxID=7167 RepID=A0A182F342_ANOAL
MAPDPRGLRRNSHHSVAFAVATLLVELFMVLQLGAATPFFGLSIQGGFRTEADIAVSARAVGLALESAQQSMASFAAKHPLSTFQLDVTATAVLKLYDLYLTRVAGFTNRLAWAVYNTTDSPAVVFQRLNESYTLAMVALNDEATNSATSTIISYSSTVGATLKDANETVPQILTDINSILRTFQSAVSSFSGSTGTVREVFERLTKSEIASIVGALDALTVRVTVVVGKLQELATTLAAADELMASYVRMLGQSFGNIDGSLANGYSMLTRAGSDFKRQLRTSLTTVTDGVKAFNDKIASFRDDVIAPGANSITSITNTFADQYTGTYAIIAPNVEERMEVLVNGGPDLVLAAAQNLLFTVYRVVEGAIRRLPVNPVQGKACVNSVLGPYVQSLSANMATALGGCVSSTVGQAEAVLRAQQQTIEQLINDRKAYFKLWNDALNGVSTTSDAKTRRLAFAKLTAQTSGKALDVLQPSLAILFNMNDQLASNLNAVLNRVKLCTTLKQSELSAQLVVTQVAFNTCLDSK